MNSAAASCDMMSDKQEVTLDQNEISGPDIVSAKRTVGLNDKGVITTIMVVLTELPLFPDDSEFDKAKLNKLLVAVGAWQEKNYPIQAHIFRMEPEQDD
ncbi:MAG: hypothetical protein Q7V17_20220 [Afipia sp.]|nr:hypothetical protein [Afipia sp.]